MSHALMSDHIVSIAEFDAFLSAQPDDGTIWELVDGQILAMTNPNDDHGQIAMTLGAALRAAADTQGCRVNVGGIRVQAADNTGGINKTIPDITVRCGDRLGRNWITDPVVIVEILSPSTMDFDRGSKLQFYKSLPTVTDIVIIYQDQIRVEHYVRDSEGWSINALITSSSELSLIGLSFSMPIQAIYSGTNLS